MEEEVWHTGKVKFFNYKNKFGFVIVDQSGEEIYVHKKDCLDEIHEGNVVSFTIGEAKRGPIALQVKLVKGDES